MKTARIHNPTYENLEATCPFCNHNNLYNRVSDLDYLMPISKLHVKCQNNCCRKEFNITSDEINPLFIMLLDYCRDLISKKNYIFTIVTIVQAYEVFFNEYLFHRFIFDRIKGGHCSANTINVLSDRLYKVIRNYSFDKMRILFINLVLSKNNVKGINDIKSNGGLVSKPKPEKINDYCDEEIKEYLHRLNDTNVHEKRNDVIHKYAYRPTFKEVNRCYHEADDIIRFLASHFGIRSKTTNLS